MQFKLVGLLLLKEKCSGAASDACRAKMGHPKLIADLMCASGGATARLDFFEEPDESDAAEAEQGDPSEDVDEGPEERLLAEFAVELGRPSDGSLCAAQLTAEEAREHG